MSEHFFHFHRRETLNQFNREFARFTVRGEIARSFLLAIFALGVLVFLLTLYGVGLIQLPDADKTHHFILHAAGILSFLLLYEGLLSLFLRHLYRKNRLLPDSPRFINALVEVTVPTIGIYATSLIMDGPYALQSPAMFLYFLFIILSLLRLNWLISLWTGLAAALEYLAISLYLLHITGNLETYMTFLVVPAHYMGRAFLIFSSGLAAAFVSMMIIKQVKEAISQVEEHNYVKEMFGKYVSPEIVNRLLQQRELSSEVRNLAILFFDIRNFTHFSESRSPVEVVNYLNNIFEIVVDVVNKNNGVINKFLGDGFMAFFGDPLTTGNDSANAVKASLEIKETLEKQKAQGKFPELEFGIGIHSGDAVTGNVGSSERKEYTIIGDSVNLASRVEQLNKSFGSQILVSGQVYQDIFHNPDCSESTGSKASVTFPPATALGKVAVKGKDQSVEVYRFA